MGAHNFADYYLWDASDRWNDRPGPATAEEAYRTLCSEAQYEHGHDGYNGTIATTAGVHVVTTTPQTREQASRLMDERLDNLNKWDVCEAIPLVEQSQDEWKIDGKHEVTLTFSGENYADPEKVKAALAKALKVKVEQIAEYTTRGQDYRPRVQVETKVTAEAPKEKTETRFFLLTGDGRMPRWEDGHPSQAEARKALPGVLRHGYGDDVPPVDVEIISMTRRVTGEPLVKARVEAKKVTATLTVTLRTLVKRGKVGTKQVGWVFYGWAAS